MFFYEAGQLDALGHNAKHPAFGAAVPADTSVETGAPLEQTDKSCNAAEDLMQYARAINIRRFPTEATVTSCRSQFTNEINTQIHKKPGHPKIRDRNY